MTSATNRIKTAVKKVTKTPTNYPLLFPEVMGQEHIESWKKKIKKLNLYKELSNDWSVKNIPFVSNDIMKKIKDQFRHQNYIPKNYNLLKFNMKEDGFLSHIDVAYLLPLHFIFGDGTRIDVVILITGIHRELLFVKEYQMDETFGVCVRVKPEWTPETFDQMFWKDISALAKFIANPPTIQSAPGTDGDMISDVTRQLKENVGTDFDKIQEDETLLFEEITKASRTIIEYNENLNLVGFVFKAENVKSKKINDLAKMVMSSKDFSGKRSSFNTTPEMLEGHKCEEKEDYPQIINGKKTVIRHTTGSQGNFLKLVWRSETNNGCITHLVISTDAGNSAELKKKRILQYKYGLAGLADELFRAWDNATKNTSLYKNANEDAKKKHRQEMVDGFLKKNIMKYFMNNGKENPTEEERKILVNSVIDKKTRQKLYDASAFKMFVETGDFK